MMIAKHENKFNNTKEKTKSLLNCSKGNQEQFFFYWTGFQVTFESLNKTLSRR